MKKPTKVFVIEYRYWDVDTNTWITRVSQEGYFNYEDARKYCEKRARNNGVTEYPLYFQNISFNNISEEFYIHEVNIL